MSEKQQKIDLDKHLHGDEVPFFKAKDMKKKEIKVKLTATREATLPQTGLSLILDFIYGKKDWSFPLNKTNIKKMQEKYGDDVEKWAPRDLTLIKVKVNNPKLKQEVDGIRIK